MTGGKEDQDPRGRCHPCPPPEHLFVSPPAECTLCFIKCKPPIDPNICSPRCVREKDEWVRRGVGPPGAAETTEYMYAFPGSKPKTILGILGYPDTVLLVTPYGYWTKDRSGYYMIFFPEKSY